MQSFLILFFAAMPMAELGNLCLANSISDPMTPTKHRKTQRRRELGSDDMFEPQKERPCIKPDGSIFIEFSTNDFGDRRLYTSMGRLHSSEQLDLWRDKFENCPESDSEDSDDIEDTPGKDYPSVAGLTEPEDIPTSLPSSSPAIIETEEPSLHDEEDGLIALKRSVFAKGQPCLLEVSAALPKLNRRVLKKFMRPARNFKPMMVKALAEVIEGATEFKVREVTLLRDNGAGPSSQNNQPVRQWNLDEIKEQSILLLHPKGKNLTEVGEDDSVCWWKYSVALVVLHDDYEQVVSTVQNAFHESIENGTLLEHLQMKYKRLVDVCLPGDEKLYSSSRDDDIEFSGDLWAVYQWIGLGLFSITIIATIAMTKTAQKRRKDSEKQDNWGVALATENDINQLLTYGWEFQGNQVRAYDKTKMIYHDDDSMLIGGMQFGNTIQPGDHDGAPTETLTTETRDCPTERSPSSNMDSSAPGSSGVLTNSTEATGTRDVEQPSRFVQSG